MGKLSIFWRALRFYFSAQTKYRVHSPFVFDFIEQVLEDRRKYYAFFSIEVIRADLLRDREKIQVTDFGAGSRVHSGNERRIQQIAQTALSSPTFCRLLFRTVNHYKPSKILEIGTSLGISTLYHRFAALNAQLITLEGCPKIAQVAQRNFRRLKTKSIDLREGEFSSNLPAALKTLGQVDYVFIDGNHRKAPTLQYFEQCLQFAHADSLFVFDDIHWSDEMQAAWKEIKVHPRVTLTIDLFFIGLVFFRKEGQKKAHYRLVPWWMKPWMMGFLR